MLEKLTRLFFGSSREPFPDFLRGLAVILMIQIHITENLLASEPSNYLFERWSYFLGGIPAAPIFIFLMGYFQAKSKLSLIDELKRGVKLFLLGLVLNLMLNLSLIYNYFTNQIDVDILSYIFGVDILFFAGLSYMVLAVLKRVIHNNYILIFLVVIIHLINYYFLEIEIESQSLKYILSFFFRVSYWSYFPLISWITFPLMGVFLARTALLEKILNKKFSNFFWIVYLIVFFTTLNYGQNNSIDLANYYSMKFDFYLYSLFLMFGWIKLWKAIFEKFSDNMFSGYLVWIGRNVTAVYFFQWVIIGNITTYLYKSLPLNSSLIVFGIVLFSVSLCTYLYHLSRS